MAGAGGAALLGSLWLPWFVRRAAAGVSLVSVRSSESGWTALGWRAGVVVAVVAALAAAWSLRPAGPLSGTWLVAGGALVLVVTVGSTTPRVGAVEAGGLVTVSPAAGLLVAYAGGAAVLLGGVITLAAYARERTRSG